MKNNFPFVEELKDEIDQKITFAVVDESIKQTTIKNGITRFPSEILLRSFKLENQNTIWLEKLAKSNCKYCNGTGQEAVKVTRVKEPVEKIAKFLAEGMRTDDNELHLKLHKLLNLPPNLLPVVDMLVQAMFSERTDENIESTAKYYAGVVKDDFAIRQPIYCHKCFIPNYQQELEAARARVKFSIN